jgi:tol-pal system protein YbgF
MLSACVSTQDLEMAKRDFDNQTDILKSKVDTLDSKIKSLESQIESCAKSTESLKEETASIRQSKANEGADLTNIRETLETSAGRIDVLQKDTLGIKSNMDKVNAKISFMEKYLDIGTKKTLPTVSDSSLANSPNLKGKIDSDTEYDIALNSFKEENFTKARSEFENYIAHYPNSEKVASAYYWIGECYYFEGNFDQAILTYDKIVKNYPATDKVPRALLKQGLCFYNLGDKISAKILFDQVVQNYLGTNEATIAQKKIQEIK